MQVRARISFDTHANCAQIECATGKSVLMFQKLLKTARWAMIVCLACLTARAAEEVRTWTDTTGRTMQAQFVREVDGDVTFLKDGKLITQRTGGGELEAFAAGDGKFFYENSLTWFELKRDAAGTPVVAMYQQGAKVPEVAARAGDIPPELPVADVPRATLESYAGNYDTPAGRLVVALPEEGPMTVKLGGQPAIPVLAVTETEFRLTRVDARIAFKSEGGKVTGVVIKQNGRELPGKRVD